MANLDSYRDREAARSLSAALQSLPVAVLSGLRQCGKSTLLTQDSAVSGRRYLTLDDFATLAAATASPETFLNDSSGPVTIDEVQRCPPLLNAIKLVVDRKRTRGRFLLSGSANLELLAGVSETLAGRSVYLTLHPMTRREIRGQTAAQPAISRLLNGDPLEGTAPAVSNAEVRAGGMPPVCLGPLDAADFWFRGYVQTYVERDVRQISLITDLIAFRTLVELAALRTAQVLNISELARDAKLSSNTASRYLDLLEASFLIRRLPPFLKNRSSRLIKSPKLYFTDSGLAGYLNAGPEQTMSGALLETWLLQNLTAILEAHHPDARVSYWSEQGRHEVDFVIESRRSVWAIECKAASRWSESDLSGLRAFLSRTPQCQLAILAYNGERAVRIEEKLMAVPIGLLVS